MARPLVEDKLACARRLRPAGPPGRLCSPRQILPQAPVSLGQSADSAVLAMDPMALADRPSHTRSVLDVGGLDNHVALGGHMAPVPVTLLPPLAKAPGGGEVGGAAS